MARQGDRRNYLMTKLTAKKRPPITPTPEQSKFFKEAYSSSGDVMDALNKFKEHEGFEDDTRWCTLNAILVAEAAIIDGSVSAYKVLSGKASTSKGGSHVAGMINGEVFDLAALQYGHEAQMRYTGAPSHFRTEFIQVARDSLPKDPPKVRLSRTARAIKVLLRLKDIQKTK